MSVHFDRVFSILLFFFISGSFAKSDFDKRMDDTFNFVKIMWIFGIVFFIVILSMVCFFWCNFFRYCSKAVNNQEATVHYGYSVSTYNPQQPANTIGTEGYPQPGYNPQCKYLASSKDNFY